MDFTYRKFIHLPIHTQHKQCADLLRIVYEKMASKSIDQNTENNRKNNVEAEMQIYNQLLDWLKQEPLLNYNPCVISDRFHWHLKKAQINKKEHNLLPSIRQGDRAEADPLWPIDIYLDNIRSAHNVGSILRTIEAMCIGTVYFSDSTPFIDHKQVQDTSMGTFSWIKAERGRLLSNLRKPIIVLETSPEAISLYDFIFPQSFTLVVGNEEYGCSEETIKNADYILEIPVRGRKNSLNVANAFAIVAGEICRQRMLHSQ